MKIVGMIATGLVALAAVSATPTAAATDTKAFSTANCKPYGTTLESDLSFTAYGVANKSTTTAKSVVCSLPSDQDQPWNDPTGATIYIGFTAGATSGNVFCTMYMGTRATGLVSQSVNTPWIAPGTSSEGEARVEFTTAPVTSAGYPGVPATAICTLSPRTNLNALWVQEFGETDTVPMP